MAIGFIAMPTPRTTPADTPRRLQRQAIASETMSSKVTFPTYNAWITGGLSKARA